MAGAAPSSPSGNGGKKPLDAVINLVPFIDLLSCCISFLLITAVWVQISWLGTNSQTASKNPPPELLAVDKEKVHFHVFVCEGFHRLELTIDGKPQIRSDVPFFATDVPDYSKLEAQIAAASARAPENKNVVLQPMRTTTTRMFSRTLSLLSKQGMGYRVASQVFEPGKGCTP